MKGVSTIRENYPLFPVPHDVWLSLDEKTRQQVIDVVARLLWQALEVEMSNDDQPRSVPENET